MAETIATAGDYANLSIDKEIKVCCNGNSNITVQALPTVPSAITAGAVVATQVPVIVNANFKINKTANE